MEPNKLNYQDGGILLLTTFEQMSCVNTTTLNGYLILACDHGRMSVDVDGTCMQLNTYEALILAPKTHLSNLRASKDIRCDLCVIKVDTAKELLKQHIKQWDFCIYLRKTNHIVTTEETYRYYIYILSVKMKQVEHRYYQEEIHSIIQGILFDYLNLMMDTISATDEIPKEGEHRNLFRRFMKLLTNQHVKHQQVKAYADELCVSGDYLIKVCKELTGKTALQWIHEYLETDIRYYLLDTDKSTKEICNELGFSSLSSFGHYCRRNFGYSPNKYRKIMKEN